MRLDKLRNLSSDSDPRRAAAVKSRSLVYAAMMAAALSATACGPTNEDPNGEGTDAGGSAGGGGTDAGGHDTGGSAGAGGSAGGDSCADLEFDGLGSKVYEVGEDGSFTLSGLTGINEPYNGMTFEVRDGAMFVSRARVGLQKVIYDNYQTGYDAIGDVSGVRPVVVDADQPYIDDGNDNCRLNELPVSALDADVMSDPLRQPVIRTPEGYFTTVFNVKDNFEETGDYTLLSDRTEVKLDTLHTASEKIDVILANSKPDVNAALTRDSEGHLVLDLNGTTDEGFGDETVLNKLNANASGVTFVPVPGQPGKFRTDSPNMLTSINLDVQGLNQGLTNDTSSVSLEVSCQGIDCNGHGSCSGGLCQCDAGFDNNDSDSTDDCDGCDTESGLYENDYPTCSPDVTPPSAPVITTNGGGNFTIFQSVYTLEGTTDSDTHEIWYNIDGGSYSILNGYTAFNTNFSYNGSIPVINEVDIACFKALDKADNESGTDCIAVLRQ